MQIRSYQLFDPLTKKGDVLLCVPAGFILSLLTYSNKHLLVRRITSTIWGWVVGGEREGQTERVCVV